MVERRYAIAIANGKGGVGKTTLTANLAGVIAAKAERTVLAVDLDAQRNLGTALGIDIAAAPTEPPGVIPTGRDRYSYAAWDLPAGVEAEALSAALDAVNADIALLDTPPSATSPMADAALAVARWLVIPARCDRYSLDGIATLLARALTVGDGLIDPLAIVLFAVNPRATAILRDTRADLEERLQGAIYVCDSSIRYAERAQVDGLEAGLLAGEYAALARQQKPWWEDPDGIRLAGNADLVASDYEAVTEEIAAQHAAAQQRRRRRRRK